jgi:hypothetical protein
MHLIEIIVEPYRFTALSCDAVQPPEKIIPAVEETVQNTNPNIPKYL